jgi:hypothetical protein
VLGIGLRKVSWFGRAGRLEPGAVSRKLLRIPQSDAQQLLRGVVRRVADIPVGSSPAVVWQQAGAELLVLSDEITIACAPGIVTMGVTVQCDQTRRPVALAVPIAVGTADAPAGLVMHTFDRLAGPEVVTARWSEAVTAFAWEALLELARTVCAAVGKDTAGHPLIPGSIGADTRLLLLQPMAPHAVKARGSR